MGLTALLLSRLQFAFTISFHIIFPAFTIGIAAWLAFLEVMTVATARPVYRKLFAMLAAIWHRMDRLTYPAGVAMFIAAFATMVLAVLPYIVPFSLTIADAAAPHSSLAFLFWGAGIVVLPITLAYTGVSYFIFRGKISPSS